MAQDGIAVERGLACEFQRFLEAERGQGPGPRRCTTKGRSRHRPSSVPATTSGKDIAAGWCRRHTEANATLTITFRGPGTLWLTMRRSCPRTRSRLASRRGRGGEGDAPGIIRFGGSALEDPGLGTSSGVTRLATPTAAGRSGPGVACSRPGRAWKNSSSFAGWSTPSP